MKTIKLITIGIVLFLSIATKSQVSVNVNVGAPPPWGPVGYTDLRYYYIPDVEAYYDIQASMFIFNEGGVWVHRGNLPGRYRGYDLYGGYKMPMTGFHGEAPYEHFKEHREKYGRGYHNGTQKTIGERPGKGNSGERKESHQPSNERHDEGNHKSEGPHKNEQHGNEKGRGGEKGHGNEGGKEGKK